jgi:hypothetical protein
MVLQGDEAQLKLDSARLVTVLILVKDRCTVCAKYTIVLWNLVLVHLEVVLVSAKDSCTVCASRTIGLEIILDAPDGTPR